MLTISYYLKSESESGKMFDLNSFIGKYVTKRPQSMFLQDIENNKEELSRKIKDKTVLVVGGAGSIGSSFIKAILPFKPATLVVVDTNENALAELTRDLRSTKGMYVPEDYIPYPMDFASPVFEKMLQGKSNEEISNELFISLHSVHNYVTYIYTLSDVHNRTEFLEKFGKK